MEQDFHVFCVSYDGFDETEDTIFPDMLAETEKIEDDIQEHYEDVQFIKIRNGKFMNPGEAKLMMLAGSTLILRRK